MPLNNNSLTATENKYSDPRIYAQDLNARYLPVEKDASITPARTVNAVTSKSVYDFLRSLGGEGPFTFQTFDDSAAKRRWLAEYRTGSIADLLSWLKRQNDKGAGVFVMVNAGDGQGRSAQNVTHVRAVFVDLDGSPLDAVRDCELKPHITVESSPGRYHAYWLVDGLRLDDFRSVQRGIIQRFDGDPAVTDLCRVMRLPGFRHQKGEPFTTKVLTIEDSEPYTAEQVKTAFPERPMPKRSDTKDEPADPEEVRSALEWLHPDSGYHQWLRVGFALHHSVGDDGLEIWDEWSQRSEVYDANEIENVWWSFGRRRSDKPVTVGTLYKMAKDKGWCSHPVIREMNKKHAFIHHWGATPRILSWRNDSPMGRWTAVPQTQTDICARYANQTVEVQDGDRVKQINKGKFWLEHPGRLEYDSIVFAPEEETPKAYNLWRGFGVGQRAGHWSRIKDHIRCRIAGNNDEYYNYIIHWLAWCFQNPGKPAEVAIVVRGGRGTGKGMFARAVMKVFGQHAIHLSNPKQVSGGFNAQQEDCAFMFADEAVAPNNAKAREDLKRMITEPTLNIERKGIDAYQVKNRLKLLMASNNDWVVPVAKDERRFVVFDVAPKQNADEAYFTALMEEIDGDGPAAMLHDLRNMDLGDWHPRSNLPETKALNDQKAESLGPVETVFLEMLQSGETPVNADGAVVVPTTLMKKHIQAQCKNARVTLNNVAELFEAIGAEKITTKRPRGYQLPSLAEARAEWDKNLFPVEWDKADTWVPATESDPEQRF